MKIEDLHHVAISVTDVERSREFYKSILALEEIERPDFDFPGAWFGLGNRQLHLIRKPDAKTLRGSTEVDGMDGHFALRVRSYRETTEHLKAKGIPFRDSPVNPTP